MPQLAQKVKLFLCFAPAYKLVHLKGPYYIFLSFPEVLTRLIWGNKEYCILSNKLKAKTTKACSYSVIDRLCLKVIFAFEGRTGQNLNVSRADVYAGIFPDFTSVKTVIHWGQVFKSSEFKYFDYRNKNKAVYNKTTPPFYNIEDMIVPTAVWNGGKDIVESKKDIELLLTRINHLAFHKYIPEWHHMDYVVGLDAPEHLYPDVLHLLQKYK